MNLAEGLGPCSGYSATGVLLDCPSRHYCPSCRPRMLLLGSLVANPHSTEPIGLLAGACIGPVQTT
jgi:hypothetical protein